MSPAPTSFLKTLFVVLSAVLLALGNRASAEETTTNTLRMHPSLARYREVLADKERFLTIVALGDSNTEVNWTTRGHLNWTGLVQAGLFESGHVGRYTLINSGVSGDTTADALARLDRDVLAHRPDLVIVSLGGNDSWKADAEHALTHLRQIIHRLREQQPPPSILLRTPQPNYDVENRNWKFDEEQLQAIAKGIRDLGVEENVAVVDHYFPWLVTSMFQAEKVMYDLWHPNEIGHRQFYKELAPVLGLPERFRWEKRAAGPQ